MCQRQMGEKVRNAVDNKFCFVICTNNELLVEECQRYIDRIWIPEGYETETIVIREADSLTSAYNAAIAESDAKYKIYLHQDMFIVNRWFLRNVLEIFKSDDKIGLIGLAGTQYLADNGIFFQNTIIGRHWPCDGDEANNDEKPEKVFYVEAVAVDGAIIVTSRDVRWREDIFDGFDYYDLSESLEHRRAGYKVVIPAQNSAWCIHDDGSHMSLSAYDKYRKAFLKEYNASEFSLDPSEGRDNGDGGQDADYLEKVEDFRINAELYEANEKEIFCEIDRLLLSGDSEGFLSIEKIIPDKLSNKEIVWSGDLEIIMHICSGLEFEKRMNVRLFTADVYSAKDLLDKYVLTKLHLRRIEFSGEDDFSKESYQFIDENDISAYIVAEILFNKHSNYYHRTEVLQRVAEYYLRNGKKERAIHYLSQIKLHQDMK